MEIAIENYTGCKGDSIGDPPGPTKLESLLLIPNSEEKINILGTEYTITVKKYEEDEAFERRSIDGYCDDRTKQIVVCDMSTYKGWEYEPKETIAETQKEALRHEIVHAFLSESGLCDSSLSPECAWSKNEEMVDCIALQGPKIFKAWQEAGAM